MNALKSHFDYLVNDGRLQNAGNKISFIPILCGNIIEVSTKLNMNEYKLTSALQFLFVRNATRNAMTHAPFSQYC